VSVYKPGPFLLALETFLRGIMAATKIAIAPRRTAQISKAGGAFESVEREIPKPDAGRVRIKVQTYGICHSDCSLQKASGPAFSIREFQDTRSPAKSTIWGHAFPSGRWDSASVWAGTAATTARVCFAGAETFAVAGT